MLRLRIEKFNLSENAMEYYLGLDRGGTTIKAALFTAEGKEAGVARSDTALITPRPDFIECDMEQMWKTICSLIQKIFAKSGVSNTEIAGVGICGHGKGLYLWGNNNAPIRNGILSSDNRAFTIFSMGKFIASRFFAVSSLV